MRVWALITFDENGSGVTLHRDRPEAFEALRQYLNDDERDYQDPIPEDANTYEITEVADDRSQFAWDIVEVEVPS